MESKKKGGEEGERGDGWLVDRGCFRSSFFNNNNDDSNNTNTSCHFYNGVSHRQSWEHRALQNNKNISLKSQK